MINKQANEMFFLLLNVNDLTIIGSLQVVGDHSAIIMGPVSVYSCNFFIKQQLVQLGRDIALIMVQICRKEFILLLHDERKFIKHF